MSGPGGALQGIYLFSFATGRYERLTASGEGAAWLHHSRRFLYLDQGKVFLFDLATRRSRLVLPPPSHASFIALGVAPGDDAFYPVLAEDQGDIFLMDVKAP
jgi:hypothetical protein